MNDFKIINENTSYTFAIIRERIALNERINTANMELSILYFIYRKM